MSYRDGARWLGKTNPHRVEDAMSTLYVLLLVVVFNEALVWILRV